MGHALRQTKHRPYIATKCGRLWNEKKEPVPHLKRESVRRECLASLQRLGVERIDLYQMHWPSQITETVGAADWNLSKKEIDEIEKLLAQRDKKLASSS